MTWAHACSASCCDEGTAIFDGPLPDASLSSGFGTGPLGCIEVGALCVEDAGAGIGAERVSACGAMGAGCRVSTALSAAALTPLLLLAGVCGTVVCTDRCGGRELPPPPEGEGRAPPLPATRASMSPSRAIR